MLDPGIVAAGVMRVKTLGERIREWREEKGVTQQSLARDINVDQSQVSRYENGTLPINRRTARAIAAFFKVSLDELVAGTEQTDLAGESVEDDWSDAIARLKELHPGRDFTVTTCLWCGEGTPCYAHSRYTTLCSWECAAEMKRVHASLGWSGNSDVCVSPLFDIPLLDDHCFLWKPTTDEIIHDLFPDEKLMEMYHRRKHARGPLRDYLLRERSELRAVVRGGVASPPVRSGWSRNATAGTNGARAVQEPSAVGRTGGSEVRQQETAPREE